jgi:menaquinol-cytochrome c reductase iron-sulfur subunit
MPEEHEQKGTPGNSAGPPDAVTRRRFLGYASGLLSAIIGVALGLPLARFFVGDAFRKGEARWLRLGPLGEVEVGRPKLFRSSYLDTDGWRQMTRQMAVYAVTQDGEQFVLFSNACTHLGCPVHWDKDSRLFLCPCHNGGFALDGEVTKGPAPRPLDRLQHRVEDGMLYVKTSKA